MKRFNQPVGIEIKSLGADNIIAGYASLFNVEDLSHDIVLPGAFKASLAVRPPSQIRMLSQHDITEPVGVWLSLAEDVHGLYAQGRLATDASCAADLMALIRAGAIDGLSIGFKPVRAQRDRATGRRRLIEVDLYEISIVTFPMLPAARLMRSQSTLSRSPPSATTKRAR